MFFPTTTTDAVMLNGPGAEACGSLSMLAQAETFSGERFWYGITWHIGWPWLLMLLLAAIGFGIFVYRRERGSKRPAIRLVLALLRISAMTLVGISMLGWTRYGARTDLPDLVLAVDVSASMSHQDRTDEIANNAGRESKAFPSRLDAVLQQWTANESTRIKRLRDRYNLKLYLVGEGVERLELSDRSLDSLGELKADRVSSRLGAGIEDILDLQRGRPTAAILLWTDGVTTEGPSIREAALQSRRRNIPLMLVGVGNETPPSDLRLRDLRVDDVVFVDDLVTFEVQLDAIGMNGRDAKVQLSRLGDDAQIDEEIISISSSDESHTVRLTHRPAEEGEFDYVVEVVYDDRETDESNNRFVKRITVRDETIRVLLVQDQPTFEYRFLKQLLGRDTNRGDAAKKRVIELTTILQDAEFEYAATDQDAQPIFPVRREDLFDYDVVILGDVRTESSVRRAGGLGATDLQNLHDFVYERGGGLIFLCGPRHFPAAYLNTPLEKLFAFPRGASSVPPVEQLLNEANTIVPTPVGLTVPLMMIGESAEQSRQQFQNFEGPYWLARISRLKPGVLVLAESESVNNATAWPMITLQRIGPGRVLTHYFDESYRWRALRGDIYFERYWIQALRYLSRQKLLGKGRQVELSAERTEFEAGEPIRLVARFFDPTQIPNTTSILASVADTQGERVTVELNQETGNVDTFTGTIRQLQPGYYVASLAQAIGERRISDDFTVREPAGEMRRLQMNKAELQNAADISEGVYYSLGDSDAIWKEIPKGRQVNIAPLDPKPLWSMKWPILVVAVTLVLLLTLEWVIRKQVGMT